MTSLKEFLESILQEHLLVWRARGISYLNLIVAKATPCDQTQIGSLRTDSKNSFMGGEQDG